MSPPRRQWYDKLADALLGDDDGVAAAANRYALICQRCFAHNGLVKEEVWEDTRTLSRSISLPFLHLAVLLLWSASPEILLSLSPSRLVLLILHPFISPVHSYDLSGVISDSP